MKKLSTRNLLVAAALFSIAAESTWSEEAAPSEPAAAAEQTASPVTVDVQEYAPTPNRRGYEQYWQQPPHWREPPPPPPGYYDRYRPYYPPYRQYRDAPAAPTENPLSAELTQTQEQLAAKSTELNTANEQLASLQAEQQATRAALQQAQSETAIASEQLSAVMQQMDSLNSALTELQARLDDQNTGLLNALDAAAAENDNDDSAVAGDVEQVQSPAPTSAQPKDARGEQTEAGDNDPSKPEAL